jgi:hypothetical protein
MHWFALGLLIVAFLALCDGAVVATLLGGVVLWLWWRRMQ